MLSLLAPQKGKMAIFGQKLMKMMFLEQKMTFFMDEGTKCRLCLIYDGRKGKMLSLLGTKMSKMAIFGQKNSENDVFGAKNVIF